MFCAYIILIIKFLNSQIKDAMFAVLYFWHAQAYDNLKKKVKKMAAAEKVEAWKTGGGSADKRVDSTDDKLLALLGNRAEPLPNEFDSDANYHCMLSNRFQ